MLPYPKPQLTGLPFLHWFFLPIVAVIAIPLYAYHHDFSLSRLDQHVCITWRIVAWVLQQVITAYGHTVLMKLPYL